MMITMRPIFIFLLSFAVLLAFFYFYPAHIFESKITGTGSELIVDLSLKNILFSEDLPEQLNPANINSIRPTVSGLVILLICLVGIPLMIAYRFSMMKKKDEKNSNDVANKS